MVTKARFMALFKAAGYHRKHAAALWHNRHYGITEEGVHQWIAFNVKTG